MPKSRPLFKKKKQFNGADNYLKKMTRRLGNLKSSHCGGKKTGSFVFSTENPIFNPFLTQNT
jgi:hypothetical protein